MRIAVLGAGGVGGYYGGAIARRGHPVVMLARGSNLDALRNRGIEVRSPEGSFVARVDATDDPEGLGKADFAIVGVKTYSLAGIVPAARLLANAGTTIVPLLNGVEVADRLVAAGVPADRILGGLTHISVARVAPGVVERKSPFQKVAVGELAGGGSERAETIAAVFREAGAEASVSAEIVADLWRKFAFIASMAAGCGLARSSVGPIRKARFGRLLFERAVGEAFAVARARGVALREGEEAKVLQLIDSLADGIKPSFLLDLESGGPTELDDLCGAVARLGRQAGVATPVHDTATAALGVRSAAT